MSGVNLNNMTIKKAVIPVAGYGTRFLPFTKSVPKEMLPIIDKPVIQIIVEQLVEAGVKEIVLVTGYSKRAIEDYFDYNLELEYLLDKKGKEAEKRLIRQVSDMAKFIYVRQKEQLGNGHAILQAKEAIGSEPFVVAWGDDFMISEPNRYSQMIEAFNQAGHRSVAEVIRKGEDSDYTKYGYVNPPPNGNGLWRLTEIVEKPGALAAPSDLANLGGFILTSDFFEYLEKQQPGTGGEIYLSETVAEYIKHKEMFVFENKGARYYDCGNKHTYLEAIVDFALKREDTREGFISYLKETLNTKL